MINAAGSPNPVAENTVRMWIEFDRLPFCVRAMIALAPFDYSVTEIAEAYWEAANADRLFGGFEPQYFAKMMDDSFRADVANTSTTGQERNGSYKLVRKVYALRSNQRAVSRARSGRIGRHSGVFPPVKTWRGEGYGRD